MKRVSRLERGLRKAVDAEEETGKCTRWTAGIEGQASEERFAEITSGRISSQQEARGNLRRSLDISVEHKIWRRELVWRMSSYER
jgi:hypothetical protein